MGATHQARRARVRAELTDAGVGALLVGPGADLDYLIGWTGSVQERLTLLILPAAGDTCLVVPALEAPLVRPALRDGTVELRTWRDGDDPVDLVHGIVTGHGLVGERVAVGDGLVTGVTLRLQARLEGCTWVPGSAVLAPVRAVKEPGELDRLRAAARAVDDVHRAVPPLLRPGRTEREIARDVEGLIRDGHDRVGFVIVAAGEHGAIPHHEPSGRVLEPGDPVLVDVGGVRDGYWSDCTRNYVLGEPTPGYRALHETVQQAQHAAVSAVAPGVRAAEVDAVARRVIEDGGLGAGVLHRTGHGIGLDGHEAPWIVAGNDRRLVAGMTFSVEPGVYVPDRHGVRIEDVVVVTEEGVERLNTVGRCPVTCPGDEPQ